MRRGWACVGLLLASTGCDHILADEPSTVGDPLGEFRVAATQTANDCGAGALGMQEKWEFDVVLSAGADEIYWDNGREIITGQLDAGHGAFTFETGVLIDMRTADTPGYVPDCSIFRSDVASGDLESPDGEVVAFDGELTYTFTPTEGSDCTDLAGPEGPVFLRLPCSMDFDLIGERSVAPVD